MTDIEIVFYDADGIHSKRHVRTRQIKKSHNSSNGSAYLNKNFEELWNKLIQTPDSKQNATALKEAPTPAQNQSNSRPVTQNFNLTLLADKYKPDGFSDLIGNDTLNREIIKWFKAWADTRGNPEPKPDDHASSLIKDFVKTGSGQQPQPLQPGLFWGSPGTGKTTLAMTLARMFGYTPFVINASDERNGPELYQKLKNVLSTRSLFPKCDQCSRHDFRKIETEFETPHICPGTQPLIILDEVDGVINSESGSAIQFLLDKIIDPKTNRCLIKKPIIFICNNIYLNGLKNLRFCTRVFNFRKDEESVFKRTKEILSREGTYIEDKTLKLICQNFSFDIRAVFNFLQLFMDKAELGSDNILKHLSAYDDESKSYFEVLTQICFKSNRQRLDFHYTEANIFEGLFINYLKFDKLADLKQLDKCLDEFVRNDINQHFMRSQGGAGYSHQKYAYSVVPYIFYFVKQKKQFLTDFPTFLITFKRQRKVKHEILRSLTENLLFPTSERYKYIDSVFKMLHINLKSMNLQSQQQRLLISTIRLMILLDLKVQNADNKSLLGEGLEPKTDSNGFFQPKQSAAPSVVFIPEINRVFEYQGLQFPLKFSEQSVILINSKYELVKNSAEHWTQHITADDDSNSFFQPTARAGKRVVHDYANSLRYVYHEPSESAVEYPLKFEFFLS